MLGVRVSVSHPPYTDPYVRWCGRGGAARLPPIPIFGTFRTWRSVRLESVNCSKADVVFAGSCSPGVFKKLGDLKRPFGTPTPSDRPNHPRPVASLSLPF